MLGLPVNIHQGAPQFFEQPHVHAPPIDARDCPAFQADLAPKNDLVRSIIQILTLEDRMNFMLELFWNFEHGFEHCAVSSAAHHGRFRPASDERLDRIQDDRFTSPSFAGKYHQSVLEMKLKSLDDGKNLDAQ